MNAIPSPNVETEHFISLLKKLRTAMLVTNSGEQGLHARPMVIAKVEDDGHLWFISGADTAKVHEIEHDSHVQIIAQDGDNTFLSLAGRASLVGDHQKIVEVWQEPFRVWFPDGTDDPNIELISVRPIRGEFWDNSGVKGLRYLWEAAKAYATGTTPHIKEGELHGTVEL